MELHIGKKPEGLKIEYTGRDEKIRDKYLSKLDLSKIKNSKVISTEEALKDVEPYLDTTPYLKCKSFGNPDRMEGSCHYCLNNNEELFDQCLELKHRDKNNNKFEKAWNNFIITLGKELRLDKFLDWLSKKLL